jgi:hypothetical protein
MSNPKKILLAIGIVIIAIQFIHPAHNTSNQLLPTDISKLVPVPDSVQTILKKACYDCHSNNTAYPWYSVIQPVDWLLTNHISEGKHSLNFSEFGSYTSRRQLNKFSAISNEIEDNGMPIWSYRLIHKNARLNANEKTRIINWANKSKDFLSAKNHD